MTTLGQLLLRRAWITEGQLRTAVERQQQLGGRLGTCLLELDLVTEQLLIQALSDQLRVPPATSFDLQDIESEVIDVLPTKVALRSRAIPFRVTGSRVDLAMLDVADLTLQNEISFVIGKRVTFHIATELRVMEALANYYGAVLQPRFLGLALRLSSPTNGSQPEESPESQLPSAEEEPVPAPVPAPAPPSLAEATAPPTSEPSPPPPKTEVAMKSVPLTATERAALDGVRENGRPRTARPSTDEIFIEQLEVANTSNDVGNALLDVLSGQLLRVLLFRVGGSGQDVSGWMGRGPDIDFQWFDNYSVGLHKTPVFEELQATRRPFFGRLENLPSHVALARCWGGTLDHDCLMLPLFVRDHLVCIAYGDRASLGVTGVDLDLTKKLVSKAAIAFERCILRKKLHSG